MRRRSKIPPPRCPLSDYPPLIRVRVAQLRNIQDAADAASIEADRKFMALYAGISPLMALVERRLREKEAANV